MIDKYIYIMNINLYSCYDSNNNYIMIGTILEDLNSRKAVVTFYRLFVIYCKAFVCTFKILLDKPLNLLRLFLMEVRTLSSQTDCVVVNTF